MGEIIMKQIKLSKMSHIHYDEDMSKHTTFGIGGRCIAYIEVGNMRDLRAIYRYAYMERIRIKLIGMGANVLLSSNDMDIIFVKINIKGITKRKDCIIVNAGESVSHLLQYCVKHGYTGIEYLAGVPSSIGAAVRNNAGSAYNGIADNVISVKVWKYGTSPRWVSVRECDYGYRSSSLQCGDNVILSVKMRMDTTSTDDVKRIIAENIEYKKSTQPLSSKSAGSIFRHMGDKMPAKMIDNMGLKGYSIGGAKISEKHAGFIINECNATSEDVLSLIDYITHMIDEKYHILLSPEIEIVE